ncbi:type VII secretion protein EssA [Terribacillus saccharophilus]|uniref:type VII secretion protein EssA n=1 Tax=Terribacillus saccharophilus TaxID=361277 RepID=UPI003982AEF1
MTKLKLVNLAFLFTLILLILLPGEVSAAIHSSEESERGSLELQIDRIQGKDRQTDNRETEKEKVYPDLFEAETSEELQQKAANKREELNSLQDEVFTLDIDKSTQMQEVQDKLFTPDYESEAASAQQADNTEEEESSKVVLGFLIGTALVLCVGMYMLMRKLLD